MLWEEWASRCEARCPLPSQRMDLILRDQIEGEAKGSRGASEGVDQGKQGGGGGGGEMIERGR